MKPWIKVSLGTILLLPGLVVWLGPIFVEYSLTTFLLVTLGGLAVAGAVVGGVVLIAAGGYDLTHNEPRNRVDSLTPDR